MLRHKSEGCEVGNQWLLPIAGKVDRDLSAVALRAKEEARRHARRSLGVGVKGSLPSLSVSD